MQTQTQIHIHILVQPQIQIQIRKRKRKRQRANACPYASLGRDQGPQCCCAVLGARAGGGGSQPACIGRGGWVQGESSRPVCARWREAKRERERESKHAHLAEGMCSLALRRTGILNGRCLRASCRAVKNSRCTVLQSKGSPLKYCYMAQTAYTAAEARCLHDCAPARPPVGPLSFWLSQRANSKLAAWRCAVVRWAGGQGPGRSGRAGCCIVYSLRRQEGAKAGRRQGRKARRPRPGPGRPSHTYELRRHAAKTCDRGRPGLGWAGPGRARLWLFAGANE